MKLQIQRKKQNREWYQRTEITELIQRGTNEKTKQQKYRTKNNYLNATT